MVHFWTLLFLYDFSLNDLKYASINPLQILCPFNVPLHGQEADLVDVQKS
jgi:hypothetical protein